MRTHPAIAEAEGRSVDEAAASRGSWADRAGDDGPAAPRAPPLNTDRGLLAYRRSADASTPLAEAHARASEIEERIRRGQPGIADVVVHTEP